MALRADDVDLNRDRLLVEAWQAGDQTAFDDLYRLYFDRLRAFCQRRVGDRMEAEELAQEAFARALKALPRFGGERRFYPWMTVIASRLCVDHHRRHRRLVPREEIDLGGVEDEHHARLSLQADLDNLDQALRRLGPRHVEVLELRERQGLSYRQISEHLGVPDSTVETLLFRARRALRREFQRVSAERLATLPGIGWILARLSRMRDRLGVMGAQIGPAAGPMAITAITAVMVAIPTAGSAAPAPPPVAAAVAPAPGAARPAPISEVPADPVASPDAGVDDGDIQAAPAPRVHPTTGEAARLEGASMPYLVDLGDTGVAVDPEPLLGAATRSPIGGAQ